MSETAPGVRISLSPPRILVIGRPEYLNSRVQATITPMFNLFKKQQTELIKHQYKNLVISLPSNWKYELEEGDLEACFNPKSQSTLRVHIIKAISNEDKNSEESIKSLTSGNPYGYTKKWHLLTKPSFSETVEGGKNITLITWRLINNEKNEKIVAVLTYTVLSNEKDTEQEKGIISLVENSLQEAGLE